MASSKPVIHGPDHLPGGADPIPLTSGYIHYEGDGTPWNTGTPSFDDNSGDYVVIQVEGPHVGDRFGAAIELVADASSNGGVAILDYSGLGMTFLVDGNDWPNGVLTLETENDAGGILLYNGTAGTGGTTSGNIRIQSAVNAIEITAQGSPTSTPPPGDVLIQADGQINILDYGIGDNAGVNIYSGSAGIVLNATDDPTAVYPGGANQPIVLVSKGDGNNDPAVLVGLDDGDAFYIFRNANPGGARIFSISNSVMVINGLPTSNPGISGHVWNNGGVLSIV